VFFCVNNQWAISTPISKQMASETIVQKAVAYDMPGIRVDGFDPIACWKATRDALERARAGEGPTLIEAYCYRIAPHGTADDPRLYRDEAITERWRPLEPVARMSAFLKRLGILDDSKEDAFRLEAKATIAESVKEMEAYEQPGQEVLFDDVYASEAPWTFREGLEELRSVPRPEVVKPVGPAAPSPSTEETGEV
jgi:pyruvate dehydrogenase E1 component alpha subunit